MESCFQEIYSIILVPSAYYYFPASRQLAGAFCSVARRDSGSYAVDCKFEERVEDEQANSLTGEQSGGLFACKPFFLEYFSFPKIIEEVVDIDNLNARRCAVDSVVRNKHQLAVGMFFVKCFQPF